MNEIEYYESLSYDLNLARRGIQNVVSSEELTYVDQKINRIQKLIQIQITELHKDASG